jgi:hypothetical protein
MLDGRASCFTLSGTCDADPDEAGRLFSISISDDAFAPSAAASRLLAIYPNVTVVRKVVTPADLKRRRLGHFGCLRRSVGEYFWGQVATWLMSNDVEGPRQHAE